MELCPEIWNVLHDGTLVGVSGSVPGTVVLTIECDYLRKRFTTAGEHFVLVLEQCTKFQFRPWDENSPVVTNLDEIGGAGLWILSADPRDEHCQIHCQLTGQRSGGGSLEISGQSARLQLDDGTAIELPEITSVAESYWREWSRRGPIVLQAKEIAKNILAGQTTPYDGARRSSSCTWTWSLATTRWTAFVHWEDEYEDAADEERRSYCERAILKLARDLLDDRHPGGRNWDDSAPNETV